MNIEFLSNILKLIGKKFFYACSFFLIFDEKNLTVVKFTETRGVKKIIKKSGVITLPWREGKIFFTKKNFGRGQWNYNLKLQR